MFLCEATFSLHFRLNPPPSQPECAKCILFVGFGLSDRFLAAGLAKDLFKGVTGRDDSCKHLVNESSSELPDEMTAVNTS